MYASHIGLAIMCRANETAWGVLKPSSLGKTAGHRHTVAKWKCFMATAEDAEVYSKHPGSAIIATAMDGNMLANISRERLIETFFKMKE